MDDNNDDEFDDEALFCAICGKRVYEFDVRHCDYCTEASCHRHRGMGDDVTGDQCPCCGTYEYLQGGRPPLAGGGRLPREQGASRRGRR
jgi:hypothetical protein